MDKLESSNLTSASATFAALVLYGDTEDILQLLMRGIQAAYSEHWPTVIPREELRHCYDCPIARATRSLVRWIC